ncbi:hypothetical protein [Pseudescherichia sp.]|uniref:hypothetical protein n=1 Tax=Pseudescherichia sp. TaxID=2055881 RepID=UPI0028965FE8|nr:hypothetical protein [Pseudescherichia sp.]
MNFDEHYGDLTEEITLAGITPVANSLPIQKCFLGKKFQKAIKNSDHEITTFMNVGFEKPQIFENGSVLTWSMQGQNLDVFVIDSKQLFVKGRNFWVYAVGIIE